MEIKFSQPIIDDDMINAAVEVLKSGRLIKGPKSKELGEKFAKYCGVKHGVVCSNGTTSLYIALRALNVKEGDEVLVPSHSFIASASPIVLCGAKPVFVEINENYTIDVEDLQNKITNKTKGIIAVHLYGKMCDMNRICEIAKKNNLFVIEDCAQAHGAELDGKKAGSFGDIACFSFFPAKNMTVGGDGGIAITNDLELYEKLQMLRDHGRRTKFDSELLTLNFRLSEVFAAIGVEQLKHIDDWNNRRIEIAKQYNDILTDKIIKPKIKDKKNHVFHLYVIRTNKRDELKEYLKGKGIEVGMHYPLAIHQQTIFKNLNIKLNFTEKIVNEILSLPINPLMTNKEVEYVGSEINEFFNNI